MPDAFLRFNYVPYRSVRQADVALCVISVEELERRHRDRTQGDKDPRMLPVAWGTEMGPLLTPGTLVLLNKTDLAKGSPKEHAEIMDEALAISGDSNERYWSASLATGEGMPEFVDGLIKAIKQRYEGTTPRR